MKNDLDKVFDSNLGGLILDIKFKSSFDKFNYSLSKIFLAFLGFIFFGPLIFTIYSYIYIPELFEIKNIFYIFLILVYIFYFSYRNSSQIKCYENKILINRQSKFPKHKNFHKIEYNKIDLITLIPGNNLKVIFNDYDLMVSNKKYEYILPNVSQREFDELNQVIKIRG